VVIIQLFDEFVLQEKDNLNRYRRLIEEQMEAFKEVERDVKTKPFSKTALNVEELVDAPVIAMTAPVTSSPVASTPAKKSPPSAVIMPPPAKPIVFKHPPNRVPAQKPQPVKAAAPKPPPVKVVEQAPKIVEQAPKVVNYQTVSFQLNKHNLQLFS
jgi:hypothetical protein